MCIPCLYFVCRGINKKGRKMCIFTQLLNNNSFSWTPKKNMRTLLKWIALFRFSLFLKKSVSVAKGKYNEVKIYVFVALMNLHFYLLHTFCVVCIIYSSFFILCKDVYSDLGKKIIGWLKSTRCVRTYRLPRTGTWRTKFLWDMKWSFDKETD